MSMPTHHVPPLTKQFPDQDERARGLLSSWVERRQPDAAEGRSWPLVVGQLGQNRDEGSHVSAGRTSDSQRPAGGPRSSVTGKMLLDVREGRRYKRGELAVVQIAHVKFDQDREALTLVLSAAFTKVFRPCR